MPRYPQVWKPDGTWYASFYAKADAEAFVAKMNEKEPGWIVNLKRPPKRGD